MRTTLRSLFTFAVALGATHCDSGNATGTGAGGPCIPGSAPSGSVSVDACNVQQPMDGFGAADTWAGPLTPAQITLFFDPTNGIGLSLLRIGIDATGVPLGSGAYADAKAAAKFGVKAWGAPWSPPPSDKVNDSLAGNPLPDGGDYAENTLYLDAGTYASWADVLAGFPATFKASTGMDLYGISAQNEPDFDATYASCVYTAAEMVNFVKVLGPKLAALTPPVQLLAAEPDRWENLWTGKQAYGAAILADPNAARAVNIIATHDYGHKNDSLTVRPTPPSGVTQHIWQTEMSDETALDVDIGHGIQVATWIYAAITNGGASAWHYWWFVNGSGRQDGEGLLLADGDTTNPPKRLWTLGNYSKFVRPGFVAVGVSGAIPAGILITAFKNPGDGKVVVVAINPSTTGTATLPVFVSGGRALTQVTPWVTSDTDNLAAKTPIPVTASSFTATLAAQTVTTFVSD